MLIDIGSRITLHDPRAEVISWAQRNLTVDNPEYTRRVRMNKWTGGTPAKLCLYEMNGGDLIVPFGCIDDVCGMQQSDDAIVTSFRMPPESVSYPGKVSLYDYQDNALRAMFCAKYGILQAPAGCGKTQIGIALIMALGRRALWITHTADLLKQSRDRALRYIDKSLIGTITAGRVEIGRGVTFATVQTLVHLDLTQYRDEWDVIIVDECHRVAGTPTVVTMFSKVLSSLAARHKYGLSATVHRSDGMIKAAYALLGPVQHTVPAEAVADRILRVTVKTVPTGTGLTPACLAPDGMLDYAKLITYLTENTARNELITRLIEQDSDESILILSERLEHLETLRNALPFVLRKSAAMISGKMTSKTERKEREDIIEAMRDGRKKYLFATYALAKEGLDIPCLSRLIMATPQGDYAVITQSIGRIARTCEGKSKPVCYDLVDNIPYLRKRFKNRCVSYRKAGCHIE